MVAPTPPSAELPALYRAVLDGVALLERRGQRTVATSIRRQAIAAYANAWDERHRERLNALHERVRREIAKRRRPSRARPSSAGSCATLGALRRSKTPERRRRGGPGAREWRTTQAIR